MENVKHEQQNRSLTSVEVGILWNIYMIESMVHHMSACFLKHIKDADIESMVQVWQDSTKRSLEALNSFFEQENLPAPRRITSEDINLSAPRLFTDKYYIYFGEYMSRVALTVFTLSYTMCTRLDMKEFMKKHYVDRLIRINQQI